MTMAKRCRWQAMGLTGLLTVGLAVSAWAQPNPVGGAPKVEINYFKRFVQDGGFITWLILIPMSMATGALVTQGILGIRRATFVPEPVREEIQKRFDQRQYRDAVNYTAAEPSPLSSLVHAGLSEAAGGYPAMTEAMAQAGEDRTVRALRRIEYLNLIGNISPMVGLFGTVFGMIKAFNAIVEMGGAPEPQKLADGISTALVTTFWGLLIAIPALFFYSLFRHRIEALSEECIVVAEEMLAVFKPGRSTDAPASVQDSA